MKKILSMILVVVLAMCSATSAFSQELETPVDEEIDLQYEYTVSVSSTLSISSNVASCKSTVIGMSGVTTKIYITQTLQVLDGNRWRRVTSWSKTFTTSSCTFVNTYSGLNGGKYRVMTEAKVYSGTAYETIYAYSTTRTC